MNILEKALADLEAAQSAYEPICAECQQARAAYKRSRSQKNAQRLAMANAASDDALDAIAEYHDAVERAEEHQADVARRAEHEAQRNMEPMFL